MKYCKKCNRELDKSCFNKMSASPDGLAYYCRECTKSEKKSRYVKVLKEKPVVPEGTKYCRKCDTILSNREFNKNKRSPDGLSTYCRDCFREINRKYRKTEKGILREKGYKKDRIKEEARGKAKYAIKSGKIKKPSSCEYCGKVGNLEAHHHDYSKPLDVTFLCRCCHVAEHNRLKELDSCSESSYNNGDTKVGSDIQNKKVRD